MNGFLCTTQQEDTLVVADDVKLASMNSGEITANITAKDLADLISKGELKEVKMTVENSNEMNNGQGSVIMNGEATLIGGGSSSQGTVMMNGDSTMMMNSGSMTTEQVNT